jgi:putative VirB-like lipoprotein
MRRLLVYLVVAATVAGCSHLPPSSDASAPNRCYTESGYLDSSNGCSQRAGYPDCYLVCPDAGTRKRL